MEPKSTEKGIISDENLKASWRRFGGVLRRLGLVLKVYGRAQGCPGVPGGGVAELTPGFIRIYHDHVTEGKEGKEGKREGKEGKEGG